MSGLLRELISLAEQGLGNCDEEECILLYGLILDAAFKLKIQTAQRLENLSIQ